MKQQPTGFCMILYMYIITYVSWIMYPLVEEEQPQNAGAGSWTKSTSLVV